MINRILKWVVLLMVAYGIGLVVASERGGEKVTLSTYLENGMTSDTTLWVVDYRQRQWVRAGRPSSGWLDRLRVQPRVMLERGGVEKAYDAVVVERERTMINHLMAEKYGWADWLIGLTRDPAGTTPVRLDPVRD